MIRLIPLGPTAIRCALGVALFAWGLVGVHSMTGYAGQSRSATEGVYSAGQAARGQAIYQAQCASCHGNQMEGSIGPPLVGNDFLSNWSARPLSEFVDKIQRTMPFNLPGSLSRAQSIDLAADILQVLKFRSGQGELGDAQLAQVTFPTTARSSPASAAASAGGGTSLPPPEGNLAEMMRAIAFPNSNIIFNLQVKDPDKQPKKEPAAQPFDYVEWGSTVYPGWLAVDQAAVALTESAAFLMTPGRKCQNGRPVPNDRADWKQYVAALVEVGKEAHRASQARNFGAFVDISDKLNEACAACHKVYRDKGGTEGSGGTRCQ